MASTRKELTASETMFPNPSYTGGASGRAAALTVGALCVLALTLRLPSPDGQLEYDEVISILFAQKSFSQIVLATAADTMPPLYYWLLHLWSPGGDSLFLARFLSTFVGVLSIPTLYVLGRRLVNTWAALLATALMVASPFHVFYSHYARMYALLTLLGLLESYFFVRWLQEGRERDLALFALLGGASFYVHPLAFLLLLTLDLVFVLSYRRWPGDPLRRWGAILAANVVVGAAYLPWLAYLPGQLDKVARAFWILPPGISELVRTAIVFHFHLPLPSALLGPAAFVSLLLIAITSYEVWRRWRRHPQERTALLILATLALAPVLLMFAVSQVRPVYVERAVMVSSTAYFLLLAAALGWLPFRPLAWGLGVLLALGILAASLYQFSYEEFPRSPFATLSNYLRQEVSPRDLVLHDNKLSYFPTYFFARDLPQAYIADVPGSPNDTLAPGTTQVLGLFPSAPEEAVQGHRRLWYVVFDRALAEAEQTKTTLPNKTWLDQRYSGGLHAHIGDVSLYLYQLGQ